MLTLGPKLYARYTGTRQSHITPYIYKWQKILNLYIFLMNLLIDLKNHTIRLLLKVIADTKTITN